MVQEEDEDVKKIEIVLFVENKALSLEELSLKSHLKEDRVLVALSKLKDEFSSNFHGIELEESKEGFSFVPKKAMYDSLKKIYGRKVDSRLSQAAKEILSIIAYNQGSTKHEIDDIRGSSSDSMLKFLKEKGFIKVIGRRKTLGNPCEYGTTATFLHEFNLSSIADLPVLDIEESEKFEEKDEEGRVLSGRLIKKRMRQDEIENKKQNEENSKNSSDENIKKDDLKEEIIYQSEENNG